MLEASALVAGRYRLHREVGRGGMGAVWRATHVALRQDVAVKFMLGEAFNTEAARRFLREARTAASVRHPNVVSVLDFGTTDEGTPFIVMEWLDGLSLDAWLLTAPPPTVGDLFAVADGVLAGLGAVHAAGVVHRDLKPQNIFVPRGGGPTAAKIVDFGVSRGGGHGLSVESGLTATGQVVGTPLYMPLEQLRGSRNADARSDLYAFGAVLFEGLTGRTPFVCESLADLVLAIASEKPPAVSSLRPDLGTAFDALIARTMEREPDARFQTAAELRAALGVALTDRLRRAPVAAAIETSPTTPGTVATPREGASPVAPTHPDTPRPAESSPPAVAPSPDSPVVELVGERRAPTPTSGAVSGRRATFMGVAAAVIAAVAFAVLTAGGTAVVGTPPASPASTSVSDGLRARATEAPLTLAGVPHDARVFVDGVETSLPLSLPLGGPSHRVEVSAPGYEAWAADMTLDGPTTVPVTLRLVAPPSVATAPPTEAEVSPAEELPVRRGSTSRRAGAATTSPTTDEAARAAATAPVAERVAPTAPPSDDEATAAANPYRSGEAAPLRAGEMASDPGF